MEIFQSNVYREICVEIDGEYLEQEDIYEESMELEESICSENSLTFGCCEASVFKLRLINRFLPVIGKEITVSFKGDGEEYRIGNYRVKSDVPTVDREYRDITAYDAMYDIINADVAAWYNEILPHKDSTVTLKEFRQSFIRHFGLEEVLPEGGLVNDEMVVEKTINIIASEGRDFKSSERSVIGETLSGKDVITAICEINGCFGHIGRDGKFHYIYLPQAIEGLYPRNDLYPADNLYPREPKGKSIGTGRYIDCQYEDFISKEITKLQIRQEENDIGLLYGTGDNCYIIQGNFLVFGKSSEQLRIIAENIYGKIAGIAYNPLQSCTAMGNPCIEVGAPIRICTRLRLIETYVFERILKGIQDLRDTYKASGTEKYAEKVNGVHASILQLKGKSNVLERTIEETRLEMIDMGAGLSTEISVTAGQIRTELQNTEEKLSNEITITAGEIRGELKDTKEGLENQITVTAGEIRAELKNTREGLETTITTTAAGIRADVSKTYETKSDASTEYTSIRSSISVEAGRITSEISRAAKAEQTLSSQITSTSTDLSSEIEQSESRINLSVSSKIEETKTYASTQAANAQNNANAATDNKLKSYSTTVEMNSAISLSADSITSTVSKTYETKTNASTQYTNLSSSITQTSKSITAEVTRATSAESDLSSRITVTEKGITSKVSKGEISSEISQEAGEISIKSDRITIDSTYFKLSKDGKITSTGGKIGGFTIGSKAIYSDSSVLGNSGVYLGTDGISVSGTGGNFKVQSNGSVYIKTYDDIEIWKSTSRTVISGASISVYGSSTSSLSIGSGALTFNGGGSIKISSTEVIGISTSSLTLGGAQYTYIGKSGNQIGFFGNAKKSGKKTVSKASTSSSVTASSVATVVNNLIDALQAYNLIG